MIFIFSFFSYRENFFRLCCIILDDVSASLRKIFHSKFEEKYKNKWEKHKGTLENTGKWFLGKEKNNIKLNGDQKRLIENGCIKNWDTTLLTHALIYSSHNLLSPQSKERDAVKTLSKLRNDEYGHCSSASITKEKLDNVVQKIEAQYKILNQPCQTLQKILKGIIITSLY